MYTMYCKTKRKLERTYFSVVEGVQFLKFRKFSCTYDCMVFILLEDLFDKIIEYFLSFFAIL